MTGSSDPAEVPFFVRALLNGADFAKGSRFLRGGGSDDITMMRKTGNAGLNGVANALFGTSYTDLCYGYNAFWADILPDLDLPAIDLPRPPEGMLWGDGFEIETVLNCRVAAAGMKITEVPSMERERIFGESTLRTFADGTRVLRTLAAEHRRAANRLQRHRNTAARPDVISSGPKTRTDKVHAGSSGLGQFLQEQGLDEAIVAPLPAEASQDLQSPMRADSRLNQVFLCHSSGDKDLVRNLYRSLRSDEVDAWFDETCLLPGQDWEYEIDKAIDQSRFILACLSRSSVTKAGYVQRELKKALDRADEQPEGSIFLIPVRLEECDIPQRLQRWHWVDLYKPDGYDRLRRSLLIDWPRSQARPTRKK